MAKVNARHRSSSVRQQHETNRERGVRETASSRARATQPEESALMDAAEGFALGGLVGWQLPYLKSKLVLGDRLTELATPALLLLQGVSAISLGAVCSAERLVKRLRSG